ATDRSQPHPPTLHAPPLPSHARHTHTHPSPAFTLAPRLPTRAEQSLRLLRDSQLRAARSRIAIQFLIRSSHRTSRQQLDDLFRAARAHRKSRRTDALAFEPAECALDDAIFERMKRDDRDARAAFENAHRIVHEAIEPDE